MKLKILNDAKSAEMALDYFMKLTTERIDELKRLPEERRPHSSGGATYLDDFKALTLIDETDWKKYREKLKELDYLLIKKDLGHNMPNGGLLLKRVCNNFGSPFISLYENKHNSYLCPNESKDKNISEIIKSIETQKNKSVKIPSIVFKIDRNLRDYSMWFQTWFFEIYGEYILINHTDDTSGGGSLHLQSCNYCDIIMDIEKMGIEKAFKILDYLKQLMIEEMAK